MVEYNRNKKHNDKEFKKRKPTTNNTTDYNNSFILVSIEELQNEMTELKKEMETLTIHSINWMMGKGVRI